MKEIKAAVFWPPVTCLILGLVANLVSPAFFLKVVSEINAWILTYLGSAFIWVVFATFIVCVVIMFLPFGRVRIGGPEAKPLLNPFQWVAVAICTNTAVGVLFWAAAEPLFHLSAPPASLGLTAGSVEAGRFALSTLYLHWGLLPCAIYALPGAMFAFAFYNMHTDFSLSGVLTPILGRHAKHSACRGLIDGLCLYALVAGMAASLATGTLTLSGGIQYLLGIPPSPFLWLAVISLVVVSFTISASTGLKRGVSFLSNLNLWIFLLLASFVLLYGPSSVLWQQGIAAWNEHFSQFCARSFYQHYQSDYFPMNLEGVKLPGLYHLDSTPWLSPDRAHRPAQGVPGSPDSSRN